MSTDTHAGPAVDDDLNTALDPALRRKLLIGTIVCALIVVAVAIFVITESLQTKSVPPPIQDQRDAVVSVLQAVFA